MVVKDSMYMPDGHQCQTRVMQIRIQSGGVRIDKAAEREMFRSYDLVDLLNFEPSTQTPRTASVPDQDSSDAAAFLCEIH